MSGSLSGTQDFSSWLVEQLSFILKPLQKDLGDVQSFTELLRGHGWEPPSNVQEIQNFFPINDFSNLEDLLEQVIEAEDAADIMNILAQIFSTLKTIIIKVRELANQKPR